MYKKIILSGGGVKGIAFIGAIKALEQKKLISELNTLVGVSVGSIISLVLVLGYTSSEMSMILKNMPLVFHDDISILNIFSTYGVNNAQSLTHFIKQMFTYKNIDPDITFFDLFNITNKDFIVVVTNLSKYRTEYLSYKTAPDLKVIDAIRMSINIPLYFDAIKYNNDYYIDGGVTDNYPVNPLFSNGEPMLDIDKSDTIVIKLTSDVELSYAHMADDSNTCVINDIGSYFGNILLLMTSVQDMIRIKSHNDIRKLCEQKQIKEHNETVLYIKTNDCHPVQFDLNTEEINDLIKLGYNEVLNRDFTKK
jgi:predicted acylesterase/phospholipase RssA